VAAQPIDRLKILSAAASELRLEAEWIGKREP